MDKPDPDWSHYRSFLAVLEEGSLSAAARALGLTQPTLGRHIDELQYRLGLSLFTRSQSGLAPTDAAIALRPHAEALKAATAAIRRAASGVGTGIRGSVRITASEVIGVEVLPPILRRLRESYPDLEIELVLSNRVENLLRRDSDIAVRMVAPSQDALIAKRIGDIHLGLFAHADYLERRAMPQRPADLVGHDLIGVDTITPDVRSMLERLSGFADNIFHLRSDNHLAQLAMVRNGLGIGLCQIGLARRNDRLVRVLADFSVPLDTWVTMHEDLRDSLRCRVVFDVLVAGMKEYWQESRSGLPAPDQKIVRHE
ncbi:LysR family transcriptional regulator [Thalassospira xiamenensis]|jgi:DNA-binding transcriptional LysR family regulator|uniref:LysR family transcriptional regulator n=1 Tax=Thalassospira xiamenensis TaxID=220697 RepID=UPI00200038FE|nr:LysR family transcriptional regulator [Thalassospira xiamenensis]MCK2165983.1 LysR family transcriptional regulator [Thalassospira xiamenensis]